MSTTRLKNRRKQDSLLEEALDREGDWCRDFTSRAIIWPSFEQWAAENRYRLIAMRGNRRMYQRGDKSAQMITFLEIQQVGSRVKLKSWIQVGWLSRLLRLFLVPAKMVIDPRGYLGVRYRRRVCHQINDLLERLKQPPLLHSQGAHWADLDVTTLALIFTGFLMVGLFVWGTLSPLELSFMHLLSLEGVEVLIQALGWSAVAIAGAGVFVVGAHHFFILKKYPMVWVPPASMAVGLILLMGVSFGIAKHARQTLPHKYVITHCMIRADMSACASAWSGLSEEQRVWVKRQMKRFYQEVVKSPQIPDNSTH